MTSFRLPGITELVVRPEDPKIVEHEGASYVSDSDYGDLNRYCSLLEMYLMSQCGPITQRIVSGV